MGKKKDNEEVNKKEKEGGEEG
jgi:hypothetical protein